MRTVRVGAGRLVCFGAGRDAGLEAVLVPEDVDFLVAISW